MRPFECGPSSTVQHKTQIQVPSANDPVYAVVYIHVEQTLHFESVQYELDWLASSYWWYWQSYMRGTDHRRCFILIMELCTLVVVCAVDAPEKADQWCGGGEQPISQHEPQSGGVLWTGNKTVVQKYCNMIWYVKTTYDMNDQSWVCLSSVISKNWQWIRCQGWNCVSDGTLTLTLVLCPLSLSWVQTSWTSPTIWSSWKSRFASWTNGLNLTCRYRPTDSLSNSDSIDTASQARRNRFSSHLKNVCDTQSTIASHM